jgi:hypothetical protein
MANIKPIGQSSSKWVSRAAVAGPDYLAGVSNPRIQWETATVAAEGNYKSAVVAAANSGKFGRGARRAGNAKWVMGATKKGPSRFAEGVAIAQPNWESGFRPYQTAIETLVLPARGPKGSPANLQRVAAVATTLRAIAEKGVI